MTGVSRHYADGPWGQVHYRRAGQPGAPTLMFLHQTPSHSVMFEVLMRELADEYFCLAPDNPGSGASAAAPRPNDMSQYAASARTVMDTENVGQLGLFGHHSGAAVAVQLAVEEPSRIDALMLSGPPLVDQATREALLASASDITPVSDGSHLQAMWSRMRGKADDVPAELSHRETLSALQLGDGYGEAYRAVLSQPLGELLPAIECPVLLMAGDRDVLRASLEPAAALVADHEVLLIDNAATYVCEKNADRVAVALKRFLNRG